jgi:hypothetical protein
MVCAYLMATEGLGVGEAIASIRQKRKVICPNQGFYEQLMLWEEMGCTLNEQHPKYRSAPQATGCDLTTHPTCISGQWQSVQQQRVALRQIRAFMSSCYCGKEWAASSMTNTSETG